MSENRSYFAPLIIVALAALVAALLMVVALVVWLAEVMGSIIYPCILLGAFFALLAIIIYKVSLRDTMREMNERIATIYDITRTLRQCIEWGIKLFVGEK